MIRRVDFGDRFQVYAWRHGRKVYAGTFDYKRDALAAERRHSVGRKPRAELEHLRRRKAIRRDMFTTAGAEAVNRRCAERQRRTERFLRKAGYR